MLRGRCRTTSYRYDDPDHPDRVTGVVESPAFTEDDRALLLGLAAYEASLCQGCGQPKQHAWHSELDGWYEAHRFVCHGCTAREDRQVVYAVSNMLDGLDSDRLAALSPLQIGVNTTPPDDPPPH